jgi:hypothetical protein
MAREAMKAWDNQISPTRRPARKSWMALYRTGRFHVDVLSKGWFESLKGQMPLLEKTTGMSGQKYHAWLKNNHLQHNTTNMFRYTQWSKPKSNAQLIPAGCEAKSERGCTENRSLPNAY